MWHLCLKGKQSFPFKFYEAGCQKFKLLHTTIVIYRYCISNCSSVNTNGFVIHCKGRQVPFQFILSRILYYISHPAILQIFASVLMWCLSVDNICMRSFKVIDGRTWGKILFSFLVITYAYVKENTVVWQLVVLLIKEEKGL